MKKSNAMTLAEVLITLGVIGIVSALTIPIIRNIRYASYAQAFLKTYSEIQQAHKAVVDKYGDPSSFGFTSYYNSKDNSGNIKIANMYMDEFKTAHRCTNLDKGYDWYNNNCRPAPSTDMKFLNGKIWKGGTYEAMHNSIVLQDGRYIAIGFRENTGGGYLWGYPKMFFMIDVNGRFKKPNVIGRDIFFVELGQTVTGEYEIRPFGKKNYNGSLDIKDTCDKTKTGLSCAENIVRDRRMNY